jgi:hypothetical protein
LKNSIGLEIASSGVKTPFFVISLLITISVAIAIKWQLLLRELINKKKQTKIA